MSKLAVALSAGILLAPAGAQKTYIVDQANGKGTDYTSLVAAIGDAKHGDVLQIRKGKYIGPKTLSKALTFQGTAGVSIQVPEFLFASWPIRIHSIPVGRVVTFRDLTLQAALVTANQIGVVQVDAVAGSVLFDTVVIGGAKNTPAVHALNSPHVIFRNASVYALVVGSGSRIITEGGTFRGRAASGGHHGISDPAQAAFSIKGGELSLSESSLQGGAGSTYPAKLGPASAIYAGAKARIHVRGGTTKILAGIQAGYDRPAVRGDATCNLLLDLRSTLTGSGKGAATAGFAAIVKKTLPVLRSLGTPMAGKTFTHTFTSTPGSTHLVYLSLPGPGTPIPGTESFMLTPALMAFFYSGKQGKSGVTTVPLKLLTNPVYSAWAFSMQGISRTSTDAQLTNEIVISQRR